jgi:transposase
MVQGYATSDNTGTGRRPAECGSGHPQGNLLFPTSAKAGRYGAATGENNDRYPHEQRYAHPTTQSKLPESEKTGRETGGIMLSITGMNRFYYLRNFHDLRCKNSRVLSIIHRQLNREPQEDEVFIVMSKDRRKVRLFAYDNRSFSLYEKRFTSGYKFMKVSREGDEEVYSIKWKDVVVLLQSPVINSLNIK